MEEEAEKNLTDWDEDHEDNSREATIRDTFYGFCHMKEYIQEVITANDKKWMALKRIDGKRMDAIIKLTKAQDSRIRNLKKYCEEIFRGRSE